MQGGIEECLALVAGFADHPLHVGTEHFGKQAEILIFGVNVVKPFIPLSLSYIR